MYNISKYNESKSYITAKNSIICYGNYFLNKYLSSKMSECEALVSNL